MKRPAKPHLHIHIGLRTFKTALAVTIALLITQLIGAYSPVFAGLGAIVVMTRTLHDSIVEAKTQFIALILGGIMGFLMLLLDSTPAFWMIGLGVLVTLAICNLLRCYYAASLAAIIVLSICVSTDGNPMLDLGYRLIDTTIGLAVGLAVNALIKPYNNRPRVISLLKRVAEQVPPLLDTCIIQCLYPDLTSLEKTLRELEMELEVYRQQYFHHRKTHAQDVIYLQGLCQLATRIHQELSALVCMDTIGLPDQQQLQRLQTLGLSVPPQLQRKCSEADSSVTTYHLEKVLDAREYLLALLEQT